MSDISVIADHADKPFQRKGSESNAHVGKAFEIKALEFFTQHGLALEANKPISIGVNERKLHCFDLVDEKLKVIVECKSHTWTESGAVPSAKVTTWNQAMYYFHVAPGEYRKILFVLRHYHQKRGKTLAEYYIDTNAHLIPMGVEIWEFDEISNQGRRLR